MIEFLWSGGPVMVPIGLASMVGLMTFLERLWSLRRAAILPETFAVEVVELARQQRWADAVTLCRKVPVTAARICEVALLERERPRAAIRERLEDVGRREAAELERYVPILGTVASVAPLLGLLGTVGGMILTFQVIEQQGVQDVSDLAGGISQALITTFAGLSVGIPALVGNRYILARVDDLLLDLEALSTALLEAMEPGQDDKENIA